uniref:Uncharacterized protein n=1 Tax=Glossina palpalis gambiensis TaxID=67801 RepID=A0A1B0BNU4_9MUSC
MQEGLSLVAKHMRHKQEMRKEEGENNFMNMSSIDRNAQVFGSLETLNHNKMHLMATVHTQLLLAFLVPTIFDRLLAATNASQLKMPQSAITQNHHQNVQAVQQQQQQTSILTQPTQQLKAGVPSATMHDSNANHNNQQSLDVSSALVSNQMPTAHYAQSNDKNNVMADLYKSYNSEEDVTDSSYPMLSELKRENQPAIPGAGAGAGTIQHGPYPWNLYQNDYAQQPLSNLPPPSVANAIFSNIFPSYGAPTVHMPIWAAPAPVFVPYPFYMPTQMMAAPVMADSISSNYEDSLPRMASTNAARRTFAHFSPFSSIFNVPVNFMSNGKPNNIYQMGGSPNDIQTHLQYNHVPSNYNSLSFDPKQSQPNNHPYDPTLTLSTYDNPSPSNVLNSAYIGSMSDQPDSRLTHLKRHYYFNGRPEDIYVLQNNLKTLYSSEKNYY